MTLPLWAHQREALKIAGNKFALFFDPGCGKSRTAIELYKKAVREYNGNALKTIIFAPLNVCRNWQNEIRQYLGDKYEIFLVAGQTKNKKIETLEKFIGAHQGHRFLICNIEALRGTEYVARLKCCGAPFVIVDESHLVKSPTSLQTLGLFSVLSALDVKYLYLLTGTPAPQGEIDLWTTLRLMGKTRDAFFVWRKKNFMDLNAGRKGRAGYFPLYKISNSKREEVRDVLKSCSITANKNECLDLPELIRTNLYAELSPEQRKHYLEMKAQLFTKDDDGNELTAQNVLGRTLRLQQIIAGFLGEYPIAKNPRLEVLKDAIAQTNGAQFLIWTIFRSTYGQISDLLESLKISFGRLTGDESAEERFDSMEAFQSGKLRALIAHPKAGGVGVNLTKASFSIHYTRSFSLTDDLQAEARNYRGGSEMHNRITRFDIIAPDTIDEDIAESLRLKKTIQDFLLGLKQKYEGQYDTAA
jgi:SNF2 family DNA or RNA helicase